MIQFNAKLGGAVAIATFIATVVSPAALAETTVNTTNNGAFSHNKVTVKNVKKTTVGQTNNSTVVTEVKAKSNTGGNSASFNTGGNTTVNTGNATTNVNVTVGGSTNTATVPNCGCDTGNTTVDVSNNGAFSHNSVTVKNKNSQKVWQTNNTFVATGVDANSNTGHNHSSFNTDGSTGVTTGDANTNVTVTVTGASNTLNP